MLMNHFLSLFIQGKKKRENHKWVLQKLYRLVRQITWHGWGSSRVAILTAVILSKSRLLNLWKLQIFKGYHTAYFHRDNLWMKHYYTRICLKLLRWSCSWVTAPWKDLKLSLPSQCHIITLDHGWSTSSLWSGCGTAKNFSILNQALEKYCSRSNQCMEKTNKHKTKQNMFGRTWTNKASVAGHLLWPVTCINVRYLPEGSS